MRWEAPTGDAFPAAVARSARRRSSRWRPGTGLDKPVGTAVDQSA
jgi:hypothetical protein